MGSRPLTAGGELGLKLVTRVARTARSGAPQQETPQQKTDQHSVAAELDVREQHAELAQGLVHYDPNGHRPARAVRAARRARLCSTHSKRRHSKRRPTTGCGRTRRSRAA